VFFDEPQLPVRLLGVLELDEFDTVCRTPPRPFCALSLRSEADTELLYRGGSVRLRSGDLAFIPANLEYVRRTTRDRMTVFHFALPDCPWTEPEVLTGYAYDPLTPLFARALEEWNGRGSGFYYHVSSLLNRVLEEIAVRRSLPGESKPLIAAAQAYLQEHYQEQGLRIAGMAEELHVSDSYLRLLFRQELGLSPKQHLDAIRFERAKALLNAGYDSVAAVAEKVGFSDEKTFATAFKRRYGYPPSRQRYGL
jgi:AraC-like DNA-binding protein